MHRAEPPPTVHAPAVCVRDTGTPKGRGAYATRAFAAGELVEACPALLFHGKPASLPEELRRVLFNWGVLADVRSTHCLPLGYGCIYNHENPANMRYAADVATQQLRFIAVRAIGTGEELTINYNALGGGHESDADSWFTRQGVERFE